MPCFVNQILGAKVKTLLVIVIIVLTLVIAVQASGQTVKDSLGNQLRLYDWTWFNGQAPFHHPNGNSYKNVWVYAKPRRYSNFMGWGITIGLIWGALDAKGRTTNDWGGNYVNARFVIRLGTCFTLGWLADWYKAKGKPRGYTYLVRNPRTQ